MALQYCEECEKQIDLDSDVDHFEEHKGGSVKIEEILDEFQCKSVNEWVEEPDYSNGVKEYSKKFQSLLNEQLDTLEGKIDSLAPKTGQHKTEQLDIAYQSGYITSTIDACKIIQEDLKNE